MSAIGPPWLALMSKRPIRVKRTTSLEDMKLTMQSHSSRRARRAGMIGSE